MSVDARRRMWLAGAAVAAVAAVAGVRAAEERVIKVTARKFVFEPAQIALRRGEPVVLELTSKDVLMGMNIPDFKVRSDIVPWTTMKLRFTPDRAGTFPFICDIFCGDGHEGMGGEIVVT
jgi:cytochrome c oxidase subunit 2